MNKTIYTIIFVLAINTLSSGCVPVVAAAGLTGVGAGGYYVGTKESDRETMRVQAKAESDALKQVEAQKAAQAAADQGIANQIAMNYTTGKLSNELAIYPQVTDGVVVLYGRAPSQAVADNAIRIASQQPGVTRIVSNIQVIPAGYAAAQAQPVQAASDQQLQQQIQQQMGAQQPVQYMQPPRSQNPAQIQQQSQMGLVPVALPQGQPQQQQMQPQAQPIQPQAQPVPQQYQQQYQPQLAPQYQQYQQAPQPQSNLAPAAVPLTVYESPKAASAVPAAAPKVDSKPIKPMRPAQVSSASTVKQKAAMVASTEKPSAKAEQKKNTSVELEEKSKKAVAVAATPPPKKEAPKVAAPQINFDDYHDADDEYTEFTPKALKPQAQKPAEPQHAPQPVAALNIPAPIITDENDLGYIEYKGSYQPNKVVAQKPAPQPEPRVVVPVIAPAAVAAQPQAIAPVQPQVIQAAQPVPVHHVVPAQAPVQAPVVMHPVQVQHAPVAMPAAAPMHIPTPQVANEDNDSFYEQFYHQ